MLSLLFAINTYAQHEVPSTAIPTHQESFMKLYPNPATSGIVYITTRTNSTKEITIFDVFGKIVLTNRIKTKALNISDLVPGVYVLQVVENKNTMTRKLVVK